MNQADDIFSEPRKMPAQKPGRSKQDLTVGDVFGRLTVQEFALTDRQYQKCYRCLCVCGKSTVVAGQSLKSGKTRSCGCLRNEIASQPKPHRRLPDNGGHKNQLFLSIKRRARHRDIPFSLTKEHFLALVFNDCYYCGSKPNNVFVAKNGETLKYNGVDRVDSSKGYELGNVVQCCKICNRAKSDLSSGDFMEWVHNIASFQGMRW
jgi:hypothetical protein